MNVQTFEKCFEARVDLCRRVLIGKNVDYARGGDKLHNFREVAATEGITMEQALQGMLVKHWQSIRDLLKDLDSGQHHNMAVWEEKVGDALNYLFLLRGMLEERYTIKSMDYVILKAGDTIQPNDEYEATIDKWIPVSPHWYGTEYIPRVMTPIRRKPWQP